LTEKTRRWLFLLALIVGVLIADQASKRLIVTNLQMGENVQPIPVLVPFFQITRIQNTGAAFGFLSGAGDIFLVIAVIVVLAMLFYYPRLPANARVSRIATGLICGGALGNAIDRVIYGHVVDFIHYQIPGVISNVSNLADHAVVLGVILFFIESWRSERAEAKAQKATLEPAEVTPAEDSHPGI
jgi:signal peptidase II